MPFVDSIVVSRRANVAEPSDARVMRPISTRSSDLTRILRGPPFAGGALPLSLHHTGALAVGLASGGLRATTSTSGISSFGHPTRAAAMGAGHRPTVLSSRALVSLEISNAGCR